MAIVGIFLLFFGLLIGSPAWAIYIYKNGKSYKKYFGSLLLGLFGGAIMFTSYIDEIPVMAVIGVITNFIGVALSSYLIYKHFKQT